MTKIHPSQPTPQRKPTMSNNRTHRLYSFAIAALLTLATLGGIDSLAQNPQSASSQMAQQHVSSQG